MMETIVMSDTNNDETEKLDTGSAEILPITNNDQTEERGPGSVSGLQSAEPLPLDVSPSEGGVQLDPHPPSEARVDLNGTKAIESEPAPGGSPRKRNTRTRRHRFRRRRKSKRHRATKRTHRKGKASRSRRKKIPVSNGSCCIFASIIVVILFGFLLLNSDDFLSFLSYTDAEEGALTGVTSRTKNHDKLKEDLPWLRETTKTPGPETELLQRRLHEVIDESFLVMNAAVAEATKGVYWIKLYQDILWRKGRFWFVHFHIEGLSDFRRASDVTLDFEERKPYAWFLVELPNAFLKFERWNRIRNRKLTCKYSPMLFRFEVTIPKTVHDSTSLLKVTISALELECRLKFFRIRSDEEMELIKERAVEYMDHFKNYVLKERCEDALLSRQHDASSSTLLYAGET